RGGHRDRHRCGYTPDDLGAKPVASGRRRRTGRGCGLATPFPVWPGLAALATERPGTVAGNSRTTATAAGNSAAPGGAGGLSPVHHLRLALLVVTGRRRAGRVSPDGWALG